ncbi:MAG: DnaJ domain-containing protein [Spirochaetales bacterium]|nr:DnaJ domain-containing protein [Spirochaetales bacterium]
MRDYYQVLGVTQGASLREIKRSFRQKAKEFHPDVSSPIQNSSEEAMMLLIKAYKILSDPEKRRDYDRILTHLRPTTFTYREFLKRKKDDLKCQSKLIFFDLIHGNPGEALTLYENLNLIPTYQLENYLDYGDYLECIFLLAEELEKRCKYIKAFEILKKIYLYEQSRPFFKQYTEEIVDRLMALVCSKISKHESPGDSITCIEELLHFNFSQQSNALLYKKLSEMYLYIDEKQQALFFLEKGLALNKRLAGVKKLKKKIGYPENIPQ